MKKVLKDYFVPHSENDHKPHILREVSLVTMLAVALVFFASSFGSSYLVKSTSLLGNIYSAVLVDMTNVDRAKENKAPLVINPLLENAAQMKASDMVAKNYFAHTSPEGLTPWHWFKKAGYSFSYAGENLAVGFSESEEVNNGWLNSPTHKANIVDEHFTEIGIATMKGLRKGKDAVYVVQMFGKPKAVTPANSKTILTQNNTAPVVSSNGQSANVLSAQAVNTPTQEDIVYIQEVYKDELFAIAQNEAISKEDTDVVVASENFGTAPKYSTRFERMIANQPLVVSYVLIILMSIISFGVLVFLVHEVQKRHYKHFLLAILVFLVLLGLWTANNSLILFDSFV